MLIEAEYNQGQIQLTRPLRVAHQRFRVQVLIPDAEILHDPATQSAPTVEGRASLPASPDTQAQPSDRLRNIMAGHRPYPAVRQDYLDYLESQHR